MMEPMVVMTVAQFQTMFPHVAPALTGHIPGNLQLMSVPANRVSGERARTPKCVHCGSKGRSHPGKPPVCLIGAALKDYGMVWQSTSDLIRIVSTGLVTPGHPDHDAMRLSVLARKDAICRWVLVRHKLYVHFQKRSLGPRSDGRPNPGLFWRVMDRPQREDEQ